MKFPRFTSHHFFSSPLPHRSCVEPRELFGVSLGVLMAMAVVPDEESPVVSPRSSSGGEKIYGYDLSGLHTAWDNTVEVRNRLRNGKNLVLQFDPEREELVNGPVDKTLANIRNNLCVLKPVLELMRVNNLQPPMIDRVIEEVRYLYTCSKVKVNHDTIYHQSWALRHLASLAKNTVQHRKFLRTMHIYQRKQELNCAIVCFFYISFIFPFDKKSLLKTQMFFLYRLHATTQTPVYTNSFALYQILYTLFLPAP